MAVCRKPTLTLDRPRTTPVDSRKHSLFSMGDLSCQAPATHLCHTFSGLAQASCALPASFWYQWFRTNRAPILESGVVIRENFSSYSRSKLIKFSVDFFGIFQGFSNFSTYRNEVFQDIFRQWQQVVNLVNLEAENQMNCHQPAHVKSDP